MLFLYYILPIQILHADHQCYVAAYIRDLIDDVDAYHQSLEADGKEELETTDAANDFPSDNSTLVKPKPMSKQFHRGHITLGSRKAPISFMDLEAAHISDHQFLNFRTRLATWLTAVLPLMDVDLGGNPVKFSAQDMVFA